MHISFVCQVWFGVGGVARVDLPVSLIPAHMLRNTQTHLADSSAVKGVQVNAQEGPRERERVSRGERVEAGWRDGKPKKTKTVSL